jgi:acyl carrier protein
MMTDAEIRGHVLAVLRTIAPEVAGEEISGQRPLREQVDLDSMDWLNVLVGLHSRLGVDVPEADYAKLRTLDDLVAYLRPRVGDQ